MKEREIFNLPSYQDGLLEILNILGYTQDEENENGEELVFYRPESQGYLYPRFHLTIRETEFELHYDRRPHFGDSLGRESPQELHNFDCSVVRIFKMAVVGARLFQRAQKLSDFHSLRAWQPESFEMRGNRPKVEHLRRSWRREKEGTRFLKEEYF